MVEKKGELKDAQNALSKDFDVLRGPQRAKKRARGKGEAVGDVRGEDERVGTEGEESRGGDRLEKRLKMM